MLLSLSCVAKRQPLGVNLQPVIFKPRWASLAVAFSRQQLQTTNNRLCLVLLSQQDEFNQFFILFHADIYTREWMFFFGVEPSRMYNKEIQLNSNMFHFVSISVFQINLNKYHSLLQENGKEKNTRNPSISFKQCLVIGEKIFSDPFNYCLIRSFIYLLYPIRTELENSNRPSPNLQTEAHTKTRYFRNSASYWETQSIFNLLFLEGASF